MLKESLRKENQPSKTGQKGADPSGLIPSSLPRPGDLAGAKKKETKNPAPPNRGTSPAADGVGAGRHWRLARAAHAAVLPWEASSRALASLVRLLIFFSSLANRSGSSSSPHSVASPAPRRGTSSLSWAQPGSQCWKPSKISQESGFLCFYSPLKSEYSLKPNRSFVGMGELPSSFLLILTWCFIFPHSFAAYLSFPVVLLPFYFVTD